MAFVRHSTFWRQLTALYVQSAIIKPKGKTATKCNTNTHFKAWKSSGWDFFFASVCGGKYAQIASLIIHRFLSSHTKKETPRARQRQTVTLIPGAGETRLFSAATEHVERDAEAGKCRWPPARAGSLLLSPGVPQGFFTGKPRAWVLLQ